MKIYITEMQRFGDNEAHHYIIGACSTHEQARLAGEVEKSWRGGKYEPVTISLDVDKAIDQEKYNYHMECI